MDCKGIIFEADRLRILCEPHCDYTNPSNTEEGGLIIRAEDEYAAMQTLARLVIHRWPEVPSVWKDTEIAASWQDYLVHLLKPVSHHYNVDENAVLEKFLSHYLMSIIISPRHEKPENENL